MHRLEFWMLWLLMTAAVAGPVKAAGTQTLESIRAAAEAHARSAAPADAQIRAGVLDARLALSACVGPLETASAPGSRTDTLSVQVRCPDAGWNLYVPVRVTIPTSVVVTLRPLMRGQTIRAEDVTARSVSDQALSGNTYADAAQVIGQSAARNIASGAPLAPGMLMAAAAVKRGQSVTLVSRSGGLEVRATGKAMADAATGERVSVQNPSSRRIVQGLVRTDGAVEIHL
jgi:flagella basal body P-ring formation protein FlgA